MQTPWPECGEQSMSFGPQPLSCGSRGFVLSRICPLDMSVSGVSMSATGSTYIYYHYMKGDEGTAFLRQGPDASMGEKKAFVN